MDISVYERISYIYILYLGKVYTGLRYIYWIGVENT